MASIQLQGIKYLKRSDPLTDQSTAGLSATRLPGIRIPSSGALSPSSGASNKPLFTLRGVISEVVLGSWLNILLVFVPVGFAVNYALPSGSIVFTINFIAIIPLTSLISYAIDEIDLRVGNVLSALLDNTFR